MKTIFISIFIYVFVMLVFGFSFFIGGGELFTSNCGWLFFVSNFVGFCSSLLFYFEFSNVNTTYVDGGITSKVNNNETPHQVPASIVVAD